MFAFLLSAASARTDQAAFEVASIRPHRGAVSFSADPAVRGRMVIGTASTLRDMITVAYGVQYDQIFGGPAWSSTDTFDVQATIPADVTPGPAQFRTMMQRLLAERFQMKVHFETREIPVYALTVGKSGPKLKPSASGATPGGVVRATDAGLHMEANGTMEKLASQLSASADRPVIHKTGLGGTYEYVLDWFPANRIPPAESKVPSMFVAVQEQLGLRLERTTAPRDVLVIDGAERPSEN